MTLLESYVKHFKAAQIYLMKIVANAFLVKDHVNQIGFVAWLEVVK